MPIQRLINTINSSEQHRYLYHFTDEANIPLIAEHSLQSKNNLRRLGIWPVRPGGNVQSHQLDDARGISDYVSLCLTRSHPMAYVAIQDGRIANLVYFGISTDVLRLEGVKLSFGVANANGANIMPISEAVPELDMEVLYSRTNWGDPAVQQRLKRAEKFEILVPNHVPIELITRRF